MATIQLSGVSAQAGETLFRNLSLTLGPGDRLGLIAGNGAGKSTLLRMIAGSLDPAAGEITLSRGLTLAYVEQDVPERLLGHTLREAVLDALPAAMRDAESWRADIVLADLDVPEPFHHQRLDALSGGWQRMGLIARAWVLDPDALLLDEPTNHLDLGRILTLEKWLRHAARNLPMIVASHDRRFLDATTNRTLFLRAGESVHFALPFSEARAALAERDAADAKSQEQDLKEAKRLRRNAGELYNIGINSGSDLLQSKAKQLRARATALEEAQKDLHRERSGKIELSNRGTHARLAIALEDLTVETPDGRKLFSVPKVHIFAGERVVILGANGTGKTQLLSRIAAVLAGGTVSGIRTAPSLVVGYADQTLSHVAASQTPHAWLNATFDTGDQRARALLATAGIDIIKQSRPIAELSFGQKARLGMLGLRLTEPNIYLLDEPTNHLDILGQEALEGEILDKGATVVMVSHDRAFVAAIASRYLLIDRGRLIEVESPEAFYAGLQ